jgi:hypothetical protein
MLMCVLEVRGHKGHHGGIQKEGKKDFGREEKG